MKMLSVARKSLLELLREPFLLALTMLTPLAFLLVNYAGYNTPLLRTHNVLVVDRSNTGEAILADLGSRKYPGGRPVYAFTPVFDTASADPILKDRGAAALLILDSSPDSAPFAFTVHGDPVSLEFLETGMLLDRDLSRLIDESSGLEFPVGIKEQSIAKAGSEPTTWFILYTPGLLIFAILLMIPQTALLIGREIRTGTIRRLRLTGVSAFQFLGGLTLAQLLLGLVQILALFAGLALFGFDLTTCFWPGILISLATSFSAIGLGLLVGCFIRNDSQAVNLGASVSMIVVFLTGAFFPMPSPTLFRIMGHEIGLYDFLPPTHGMIALQQTILYGSDLGQIGFRLTATVLLSAVFFIFGIWVFQKMVMRMR